MSNSRILFAKECVCQPKWVSWYKKITKSKAGMCRTAPHGTGQVFQRFFDGKRAVRVEVQFLWNSSHERLQTTALCIEGGLSEWGFRNLKWGLDLEDTWAWDFTFYVKFLYMCVCMCGFLKIHKNVIKCLQNLWIFVYMAQLCHRLIFVSCGLMPLKCC